MLTPCSSSPAGPALAVPRYLLTHMRAHPFLNAASCSDTRAFSKQLKAELFAASPMCAGCGQQILSIEDAEVDHITPWVQGGATSAHNAQLMHRFCNRSKGARSVSE